MKRCCPVANAVPSTSVRSPSRRLADRTREEGRADDRVGAPRGTAAERSLVDQQRGPRRGRRTGRRAVHLPVGEDRDRPLVQGADLLVEDGPVDPRQPLVARMARDLGAVKLVPDPTAKGDQLSQLIGHDPQAPAPGRRERVDRTAVGDVDVRRRRPARRARSRMRERCETPRSGRRLLGYGRSRPRAPMARRSRSRVRRRRAPAPAPTATAHAPSAIVPCPQAVE